jgi:hypothetical protein
MREIRMSGLPSGDWKRSRSSVSADLLSATAPVVDSTEALAAFVPLG